MAYIESHQELRTSPKVRRAARLLEVHEAQIIGHLHMLWWWAVDHAIDGHLWEFDALDIADAAGWDDDPQTFVDALVGCGPGSKSGFLDVSDDGLELHDWSVYTDALMASREGAAKGNHLRWHVARDRTSPDCEFCKESATIGDIPPAQASPPSRPRVAPDIPPDRGANPPTEPNQPNQPRSKTSPADAADEPSNVIELPADEFTDEVIETCRAVAQLIAANGHPLPTRGTKAHRAWLVEMDRLLRLGPKGQTTTPPPDSLRIVEVARWATLDDFWRANIQSVPKLREKWSTLAAQADRKPRQTRGDKAADAAAQLEQMAEYLEAQGR